MPSGSWAQPTTAPNPEFAPIEATGDTLSQSIKAAMPVIDFVSQYVELTPAGRRHCPFHEDQNSSFSVNAIKIIGTALLVVGEGASSAFG